MVENKGGTASKFFHEIVDKCEFDPEQNMFIITLKEDNPEWYFKVHFFMFMIEHEFKGKMHSTDTYGVGLNMMENGSCKKIKITMPFDVFGKPKSILFYDPKDKDQNDYVPTLKVKITGKNESPVIIN